MGGTGPPAAAVRDEPSRPVRRRRHPVWLDETGRGRGRRGLSSGALGARVPRLRGLIRSGRPGGGGGADPAGVDAMPMTGVRVLALPRKVASPKLSTPPVDVTSQ